MSVNYFKRYRMEIDLRGRQLPRATVPHGYHLVPWDSDHLGDHAEAKHLSFCHEIDADIFSCFAEFDGCLRLMQEISQKEGFLPQATWLVAYADGHELQYCGTIQGIRAGQKLGGVQNVGITPPHRGRGLGTALILSALDGFQQAGLLRAYLEVTAQNERAVRLYQRLGFVRTKTLYKAVELAYS